MSFKEYLVVSLPESNLLSMTAIEESTFSSVYFVVTESNSSEVTMCGIGYILHVVTRDIHGDSEGFI